MGSIEEKSFLNLEVSFLYVQTIKDSTDLDEVEISLSEGNIFYINKKWWLDLAFRLKIKGIPDNTEVVVLGVYSGLFIAGSFTMQEIRLSLKEEMLVESPFNFYGSEKEVLLQVIIRLLFFSLFCMYSRF